MADITNTSPVVTEDKLKDFYEDIKPFLGCPAYVAQEGSESWYSTDEKVIGRWTDRKPLYQKVIYFNPEITITANSWQNIKSDETDIEHIVNAIILRSDGIFIPPYGSISPFIGTRGIWVYTTQLQNAIQGIILKYTKTTDSAATTIQEDPNEYSTTEKIIGKWIDGKPLYQICYETTFNNGQILTLPSTILPKKFDAYLYYNDTSAQTNPFYYDANNQWAIWIDNSIIMGHTGFSAYNGRNVTIILQYTKTTD